MEQIKAGPLKALYYDRPQRFQPLLRRLQQVRTTKATLAVTCIGYLVCERLLRPEKLHPEVQALYISWKPLATTQGVNLLAKYQDLKIAPKPFQHRRKVKDFLEYASDMAIQLQLADGLKVDEHWYKAAALELCQWGFKNVKQFAGLSLEICLGATRVPSADLVVDRVAAIAIRRFKTRREAQFQVVLKHAKDQALAGRDIHSAGVIASQFHFGALAKDVADLEV